MTGGVSFLLAMFVFFFSLNARTQSIISTNRDSPSVANARAALYQKMAEQAAADKQARIQAENERLRQKTEAEFGPVHRLPFLPTPGVAWKNIR